MTLRRIACMMLLLPALSLAYNHPELEWKSVTTEHFIITYYDHTEPAVYATWKIAEESYKILASGFKYEPREKISISLADYEDFSNGFAEWTAANIQIWLLDLNFDLRSNTTWLRNVITHELTHILSLEQKRRMQTIAVSLGIAVSTPDEEYGIKEPFARISGIPSWLVEGITQYETERLGNDCYDSRREMTLRSAILSNTLLSLDEMGEFNHDAFGNEMVYNQGFAFTKYIAGRIGDHRLQQLYSDAAKKPLDIPQWFIEKTGTTLNGLYNNWVDSLKVTFTARFSQHDENISVVTNNGRFNLRPEVSPDGNYWSWLSSGSDDGGRTDLVIAKYGKTEPLYREAYAHTAHCFSAASDNVYFVKSRAPDHNGSFFNELYSLSLTNGTTRRLTTGGRIYGVAALPDGDLLCVRYVGTGFGLYRCSSGGGSFTELVPGIQGMPFITIAANIHDTSFAVVSRIVDGRSRLFRFTFATRQLEPLSAAIAQEESPHIAKDGRIYYSADYDGVFNIFSCLPDRSDLKRHTNTTGGHFSPVTGPDATCITSWFSANRFAIARFVNTGEPYTIPEKSRCSFLPLPVPKGVVTITSRPYEAKLRRATTETFINGQIAKNSSLFTDQFTADIDSTSFELSGGIQSNRSDALRKRIRMFQLIAALQIISSSGIQQPNSSEGSARSLPLQPKDLVAKWTSPVLQKITSGKTPGFLPKNNFPLSASRFKPMQSSSNDSDSTRAPLPFGLLAMPGFAFENRMTAATLGLEMSSTLSWLLLPGYISLSPYLELQLAREWFFGGRINAASMPFNGLPLFASIPFYLMWNRMGHYNEDISYNNADVTQMQISAGPQFIPSLKLSLNKGEPDTTISIVNGWMAQLSLFHGIPLFKYGSLQLVSTTMATYHGEKTLDDGLISQTALLPGESNSYLYSTNGLRLVVPVIRTINKGSRNYFDALYGHVGYTLTAYVNSDFFNRFPYDGHRLFTDPYYRTRSDFFEQVISAGFDLGRYKSHLFFSTVTMEFTYAVMRSIFSLSLTSGL